MSFEYISVEDAIARSGLRMVVVGGGAQPLERGGQGHPAHQAH